MDEGISQKKSRGTMSRRELLGAGAAAIAVRMTNPAAAFSPEKTEYLRKFRQRVLRMVRDIERPLRKQLLINGDPDAIIEYLTEHVVSPDWGKLEDTEFDVSELRKKVVMAGISVIEGKKQLRMSSGNSNNDVAMLADADSGLMGYGQVVPIKPNMVLTPGHVLAALRGSAEIMGSRSIEHDIAGVHIAGATFTKEQIAHFKPMTDADVNGQFIAITGIRPDLNLGRSGRKDYGGIAVAMTEPLSRFFKRYTHRDVHRFLKDSFVVISETHEGIPVFHEAMGRTLEPGRGMSGGIAGVHEGRRYAECAFLWGGCSFPYGGKVYTAFFLHGPDVIQPYLKQLE